MSSKPSLIQGAISQPAAAPAKAAAPVARARVQVRLALLAGPGAPAVELVGTGARVVAGAGYTVRVALAPALEGEAGAVEVEGAGVLSVEWRGPEGVTVGGEAARVLPAELAATLQRDFSCETAAGAQGARGQLVVGLMDGRGRLEVRTLEVEVGGPAAGAALPAELQAVSLVDLEHAPENPGGTAILHVEAGDKTLRLHGFHVKAGPVDAKIAEPKKSLADSGRDTQNTEKILGEVRRFSRVNISPLIPWLQALLQQQQEVALIIQEHVETRVPWEMVEVEDHVPIGARLTVVRWLEVKDSGKPLRLQTGRKRWEGKVLSYVDTEALAEAHVELDALKSCVHDPCADVQAFRRALAKPLASRALLFIASHGVMARDDEHAGAFGSLEEEHLQVTSLNLEVLNSYKEARPFAFINACHSARLRQGDYGLTGLPEVFLGKFAGAYLGTLGLVKEEHAATVGKRILQAARTDTGVCVPRLLRELRAEVLQQLDPLEGDSRSLYVNVFLYVFYGSPDTWLKLEPATQGGAGG